MRRIGFVVNPIAGMGGRVGLKGTDGMVEEARALGAEPQAADRARRALSALAERAPNTSLLVWDGEMGATVAREAGFEPEVVGTPSGEDTSAADTRAAVRAFADRNVELVLFVGGDGTAVDVAEVLEECAVDIPVLGVPAGVKIYSSVFAVTPEDAGRVAASFDGTERREVSDIDEDAYRDGEVRAELRAVVRVPVAEGVQSGKQLAGGSIEGLVDGFLDRMESGVTYLLGPGGTVGAIKDGLGFDGSPLGVDVWRDGEVVVRDANEAALLDALDDRNVIVVSPIGGQGFILGRGNQQFSPAVVRRCEIEVVASRSKLDTVGVLRVDTGDPSLDEELRGWTRVRTGRFEERMMQIV